MTHTVVYMGGPRHGEVEEREGDVFHAPIILQFPTFNGRTMTQGVALYERRESADTPGRIAYSYLSDRG